MKQIYSLFIFVLLMIYLAGCGSSNKNLSSVDTGNIPDWYLNPPKDPNYLFSPQTQTSQDMQLAINKAITAGRADIARQVEVKLNSLEKQFGEEVGTDSSSEFLSQFTQATKTVTDQTLIGSRVDKQTLVKDGNIFRAYVLVEYPLGEANQALMQQIKNNEHLYTRFRSSQAFNELDNEIKKYEDWKKNQQREQIPEQQ